MITLLFIELVGGLITGGTWTVGDESITPATGGATIRLNEMAGNV